ncbi:MAG: HdeD family acid-resistance protein, partial [Chitinophagaceae bacterium]
WKAEEDKWLLVAEGVLSLLLGFLIYRTPETFISFIAFLISFWAIFSGISRIAMAIQLRKEIQGEGWLILSGILSVLFGIIVFAQPGIGIATLMMIIAIFAILIGTLLIVLSLKLRKSGKLIGEKIGTVKSELNDLKNKIQP